MSQLPLPFERPDSARRFLFAGPNLQAVRMLERWATWPVMAALLIGVADTAGKYYLPALGGVTIYLVMIAALVLHPQGLAGRRA